jgi:hypothetical protein
MKISQLKEIVKKVVSEETEYQQLFMHMLDKTGKDIGSMSDDETTKFFNAVDRAYKAKSEGKLRGYNENVSYKSINEGRYDADLDKIEAAVKNATSFMNVGAELKKAGIKYDFSTSMIPMYRIKVSGSIIAILNKKYASGAEREVNGIAIGIMENTLKKSVNEAFKHTIHVDTPTQVVSKPIAAQIRALAKKGVRSKEIGLEMGFTGNTKLATDAFQKVKNQIYFELDKRNESVNEANNPGDKFTHKHNPKIEIELIEPTNKGWKVYQIEKGKKKIAYFDKQDISGNNSLFKSVNEAELTDKQKQIDVDKDGEIEGSDLAALRAKDEVGANDWHFKTIMKMYDKAGPFGKKKISVAATSSTNANRKDIESALRDTDYSEITDISDKLGLKEVFNKMTQKKK